MIMPNCVPQSPTWLSVMTLWPMKRATRASESPMKVLRMWPTCIGLAMFGAEKSTTMRFASRPRSGRHADFVILRDEHREPLRQRSRACEREIEEAGASMLTSLHRPSTLSAPLICSASARGFVLSCLARVIAALLW